MSNKSLAARIADAILRNGTPPCERIQLMTGNYPDDKLALERLIEKELESPGVRPANDRAKEALEKFNDVFHEKFVTPLMDVDIINLANYADLRGRKDIGNALRRAIQ